MDITIVEGFGRMCCGQCGIVFWVPQSFYDERMNDGDDWKCPNGHTRVFRKTKVVSLQEDIDRLKKELWDEKSNNIELKVGFDNRERELVRLRKKAKAEKKGVLKR